MVGSAYDYAVVRVMSLSALFLSFVLGLNILSVAVSADMSADSSSSIYVTTSVPDGNFRISPVPYRSSFGYEHIEIDIYSSVENQSYRIYYGNNGSVIDSGVFTYHYRYVMNCPLSVLSLAITVGNYTEWYRMSVLHFRYYLSSERSPEPVKVDMTERELWLYGLRIHASSIVIFAFMSLPAWHYARSRMISGRVRRVI